MNLDSLMTWVTGAVIATALTGHIKDLEIWVWRAEAKLLYESRTSTWGSPHFFGPNYHVTVKATQSNHSLNQNFKTTTDRNIHSKSRSN